MSTHRRRTAIGRGTCVLLVLLLAGCASTPRPAAAPELAAQQQRESRLAEQQAWGLVGRIAVFDGDDNGSGRIEWRQRGEHFEILLSAPVSRQSWRLSGGPDGALLEGLEQGPRRADSAEQLLHQETGWSMPLAQLRAWARGMRGSPDAEVQFSGHAEAGLPAVIEEHGWTVQYRDWFDGTDPALPRRVFAQSGDRRVRLAVERWLAPSELGGSASAAAARGD